ncbi:hypothetical protein SCHPADRAFT_894899 [Schizopora paradoxa]|uniref:Uncharacterized protein n=1 Tax=Schizopora paradoxa TaxID=27342 RepID=A0A0H2R5L7_9AGAM|nr:hypothetical protein SCHPADRAFT_894899 [Schizopora paradoxa]
MWGANHIGPALFRVSSYHIELIIEMACSITQDALLQESINDKHDLPSAQDFLLSFAEADGMARARSSGVAGDAAVDDGENRGATAFESEASSSGDSTVDDSDGEDEGAVVLESESSPYHPTSRCALRYALVCKPWYHIAQPLVFRHLLVDDRCDWSALAQRLAQPVCMGVSGVGPLCGRKAASLVRWLDVRTSDFNEQYQASLIHMLVNMDGLGAFALKTTSDSDDDSVDVGTVLSLQSTFIALFCAAMAKASSKIISFALTTSMTHSAVRSLLATVATFLHIETFVLQHDIVLDYSKRLLSPQDRFVLLPNLGTLLYRSLRGGNYPLLSHIGRWNTPRMTALIMISRTPLIGGGLIIFRNIRQLETLVVPRAYFYPEASMPRTDTLTQVIIHYCHIIQAFPVTYTNLTYIGLRGRIYYVRNGRLRLDLAALSSSMRRFAKSRVFPQLQTIQLLDVASAELFDYTWEQKEGTLWCCWLLALQDAGVAFVDKNELHLRMVPPHVFPNVPIAPSRALLNRWLNSFTRRVEISNRIEAGTNPFEQVVFEDDSELESDTDTILMTTPEGSDDDEEDADEEDDGEADDDDSDGEVDAMDEDVDDA